MNTNDFASVVPKIKVWETKLLNKSFYDKLIDSNSLEEAISFLQETPYGVELNNVNFEKALENSYKNLCVDLHKSMTHNKIIDFVRVKNDYHNAKTLIKSKVLEKDFSHIMSNNGSIEIESLKMVLRNEGYREVPELISLAMNESLTEYENTKDSQVIDIVFDRYMFKNIVSLADEMNYDFIKDYVKVVIDLTNIKTVLRLKKINKDKNFLKKVLIEGGTLSIDFCESLFNDNVENFAGKIFFTDYSNVVSSGISDYLETNSLSSLERRIDDYVMEYVRKAKYVSMGVEPVFAYLYARETESKNLRIILAGKLNNVDGNIIRERLRDNYA